MSDRFTESELLAYVEDQLDPPRAEALAARLAAEPALRDVLDRLRDDRALMRSAGEPTLPMDFVAELEPQLARPMLLDAPAPGTYRRRHRAAWAVPWRGVAAAVIAVGVVGAGLWGTMTLLQRPATGEPVAIAPDETTARPAPAPTAPVAPAGEALAAGDDETWPPRESTVVHGLPAAADTLVARTPASPAEPPAAPPAAPVFVTASFALVVEGDETADVEATIDRSLHAIAERRGGGDDDLGAALVRNYSWAEARQLVENYVFRERERQPEAYADFDATRRATPPAIDSPRRAATIDILETIRDERRRAGAVPLSGRLVGAEDLEPSYGQQLAFSGHGSTHTVTIPVSRLSELLAELRLVAGESTRVVPLAEDGAAATAEAPGLAGWVAQLATVQEMVEALHAEGADAYVHLPVIVQTP